MNGPRGCHPSPMPSSAAPAPAEIAPREFPAGAYVAVDPCRLLPEADWVALVAALARTPGAPFEFRGALLFAWNTAEGDGVFPAYVDKRFAGNVTADNCLLCLAQAELVAACHPPDSPAARRILARDCSQFYYCDAPAAPRLTADGDVIHGRFELITSGAVGAEYDTQRLEACDDGPADSDFDDCDPADSDDDPASSDFDDFERVASGFDAAGRRA
jgi:hypothetical protein